MLRLAESSPFLGLQFSDLGTSCCDELCVGGRVATRPHPPSGASVRKDPGTVGEGGVTGRVRNEGGESAHHGELLVTIEGTGVREDLDADVIAVSVHVRQPRRLIDLEEDRAARAIVFGFLAEMEHK